MIKFTKEQLANSIRLRISKEDCVHSVRDSKYGIPLTPIFTSDREIIKNYATEKELELLD